MDRFQYIAESDPNIAFSKTLKQEPFFSGLIPEHFRCTYRIAIASFVARLGCLGAFEHENGPSGARVSGLEGFEHETGPSGARVQSRVHRGIGESVGLYWTFKERD